MTGFASLNATIDLPDMPPLTLEAEVKSVNGRGLDLKLRAPDWLDGFDPQVRNALGAVVKRGSVSLSVKLVQAGAVAMSRLNLPILRETIAMVIETETEAAAQGLGLTPSSAVELLSLRGVLETGPALPDGAAVTAALLPLMQSMIADFDAVRAREGEALAQVLGAQIDTVEALVAQADEAAEARRGVQAEALKAALARIVEANIGADPGRLEQELALLAVKSDITEELDRLRGHIEVARSLIAGDEPVGRKMDFLMQEFNREANTLCSKAQHAALTRIGLDLKTVIDQMREQSLNLE